MHPQQAPSGVCWNNRRRWFNNKTVPSNTLESRSRSLHSSPRHNANPLVPGLLKQTSDSELGLETKINSNPNLDINRNSNTSENCLRFSNKSNRTTERMDHDEDVDYVQIVPFESYDIPRAKQRASIKWLLSKAYNNKTPEDLLEPFYKDHEGEEHLKPHIVKGLSDAELYCLALCNLYADPNYSQLSPWGIVQALARKGSYVQAPPEIHLTETILMQNRPLRVNAHISVIEAMMVLHVRELISAGRIVSSVQRYGSTVHPLRIWFDAGEMPSDIEEALLLWINRAVLAIKEYIQSNTSREHGLSQTQAECWNQLPLFQDFSDLTDGVGLCALLAFYCQDEISLSEITVPNPGEPLNISESLWNLQLLQRVCRDSLPFNVCHFNFEDILYFSDSMKQNMLSFLADIFNLVELNPSSVVKLLGSHREMFPLRPGLTGEGVRMRRGFVQQSQIQAIPDLRTSLYTHISSVKDRNNTRSLSAQSTPKKNTVQIHERTNRKSATNIFIGDASSGRKSPSNASIVSVPIRRSGTPQDYTEKAHSVSDRSNKDQRYYTNSSEDSEEFVVHRGRNVPTLSQVIRSMSPSSQDERSSPASRMSQSRNPVMSNDVGDESGIPAAGRPSNQGANKTTYAGRRSRRNSFTEADSQLTVENFGGSQDNLNRFTVSRNPDKQPAVLTESLISPVRFPKRQTSVEPPEYYSPPVEPHPQRTPAKERLSTSSSDDGRMDPQQLFYGKRKPGHENQFVPQPQISRTYSQPAEDVPYSSGSFQYQQQRSPNVGDPYSHRTPEREPYHPPSRSTSMTNLSRLSDVPNKPVNIVYLSNTSTNGGSGYYNSNGYSDRVPYTSSQEDSQSYHHSPSRPYSSPAQGRGVPSRPNDSYYNPPPQQQTHSYIDDQEDEDLAAQVAAIRSRLEEKRRRIEMEKGRMESVASKQQFKLGKAAYLKAINKDRPGTSGNVQRTLASNMQDSLNMSSSCARKGQLVLKDLENKWLNKTDESCRTPEIENMDKQTYQKSLARIDLNLSELEQDMNKLSVQEAQLSRRNQFFLHGEPPPSAEISEPPKRKTWNVPNEASASRVQWDHPQATKDKQDSSSRPIYNGETRQGTLNTNGSGPPTTNSFRLHSNADSQGNRLFNNANVESKEEEEKPTPPPRQRSSVTVHHAPLPTPPPDDMEPQSVCFVQDDNPPSSTELNSIASSKKSLQITSGSKTYRITPESGSPPRPTAHRLFIPNDGTDPSSDEQPSIGERGFYIPMDEAPKRPKPPLRSKPARRANGIGDGNASKRDLSSEYVSSIVNHPPASSNESNGEEDFKVQKYTHREGSYEDDEGRLAGGELVIDEKKHYDPSELDEMEKKKERILLQSLKRQQMVEDQRRRKEFEAQRKKELEARKAEEKERKKEEEKARKQAILESYRMKKQDDLVDKDGYEVQETKKFLRPKSATTSRQRPKTIHMTEVDSAPTNMYGHRIGSGMLHRSDSQTSSTGLSRSYGKNGSSSALYSQSGVDRSGGTQSRSSRRDPWGSTSSLNQDNRRGLGSVYSRESRGRSQSRPRDLSTSRIEARSRRDNYMGSQDYLGRGSSTSSLMDGVVQINIGENNRTSAIVDTGMSQLPRRPISPTILLPVGQSPTARPKRPDSLPQAAKANHSLPSPSAAPSSKPWPGSLPPGLVSRRGRMYDDGASDISSVVSSNMDFSGLRLYKQPTAKSNRGIILNAVEYCVFPGAVNHDSKMRVLDEINRAEAKHFLIMFRDAGCQFRALYAYIPENDEIAKLFGVGPRSITENMFEKFFKYNSGGKCFSVVHTKHLTVTIDAFTIHNSLWQGKKGPQTRSKDMALVI